MTCGSEDRLNNTIDIAKYVIVPKSENKIATGF